MYLNKLGLSTVIATVLILMLTIVAVAVLANFLIPFVKNSLQKSTECLDVQDKYSFEEREGLNCVSNMGEIILAVRADGAMSVDDKTDGFDLVLSGNGL